MATEFDTGLPSVRQLQGVIREQSTVEVKLLTGDVLNGMIVWQDAHAICLSVDGATMLMMRAAIAYVKISA
ncbi:Hfq-related RNA-binding protein [Leptothoe kymatousa]|uniref:RNA chaperone Hfq n=1 Tax=Leptothoe kymatousa TAU-MAC 1615 TaxID=2364775 RepID=A0ABS5Y021_9CYAN|nr:RNA chaperone Hfq [Leptothoe kymatousa]MBT9311166.1 RNA chaperone Hfq [Leptothoe kymatousa TAU-MAC 1615]